ncbi:hypothetical protein Tco_1444087, partial [Tanacetum coccineum]
MGSSLHSHRNVCIDMSINGLFFHVQDEDDRHGGSKDSDYVSEKLHMNVDDTGVKNIAFVFVVEGLRIHNPIKEDLKKTRFSEVQDVFHAKDELK